MEKKVKTQKKYRIIINADDFGMSRVFNQEILTLLENGKISSTTVLVDFYNNQEIFQSQTEQIQKLIQLRNLDIKKVAIGLHLDIKDTTLDKIGIENEIDLQVAKFKEVFGFPPSHIDIHKPQSFPKVYEVLKKFCKSNNILFRNLSTVLNGTKLSLEDIKNKVLELREKIDVNFVEIFFHPGKYDPNCISSLNKEREEDVRKILGLESFLKSENIELINFSFFKMKDYLMWGKEKALLNNFGENKWCREGTIWWCQLGENVGFEEDGKGGEFARPVLVIKNFSIHSTIVIPLTTSQKINKYHCVVGTFEGKTSVAILSQVRYVDTRRMLLKIGEIQDEILEKIKKSIKDLF